MDDDKLKKLNYRIEQSEDCFEVARLLLSKGKVNHALNRLYFGMYYLLLALSLKYRHTEGDHDELSEWFEEAFVKPRHVKKSVLEILREIHKKSLAADYEAFTNFTQTQGEEALEKFKEFFAAGKALLEESPTLQEDTLECLKKSLLVIEDRENPLEMRNVAGRFVKFVKEKIFDNQGKAIQLIEAYKSKPGDLKLEGKLELRLSDTLEEKKAIFPELENLLFDAKDKLKAVEIPEAKPSAEPQTKRMDRRKQSKAPPSDENTIIVPWDFSPVAQHALDHAIQFARIIGGKIHLLHIVKRDKEKDDALGKLEAIASKTQATFGVKPENVVREGNIYTEITKVAAEREAKLVIMGTHGMTGMQKLTGSKALKVIAGTKAPFVVVQQPPAGEAIREVLFPVDFRPEVRQKLNQAKFLAKYYDLKFHICTQKEFSIQKFEQKAHSNLHFVKSFFNLNGIDFQEHEVPNVGDTAEMTETMAQKLKPDLIMILTTKDIALHDYILGAEEQNIIANSQKIPVMCVNPRKPRSYSYSASGG